MQPTQINEAAAHLAGKDDRYLMLVAVLMLIVGGALVIRYLVEHLGRLQTRWESQTEQLIQVAVMGQHTADSCRAAIDNNTKTLERVSEHMRLFEKNL